jgi:hypothetical protein
MALEHVGQLAHDVAPEPAAGQVDLDLADGAIADDVERGDLGDDEPARFLVPLVLAADEQHRLVLDQRSELAEGLGEHDRFNLCGLVLETEHRHPVAALRLQMPHAGRDAANRAVGFGLREVGQPASPGDRQRFGIALERMPGDVEPERFLLEGERFGFRPGPRRRQRGHVVVAVQRTVAAAEQLRLALLAVLLLPASVVQDPVQTGQEPRPPGQIALLSLRRERIERAGLDQAFEHLLVHEPEVDVLGQREERVDPAAQRLAGLENRPNRPFPRALDRAQAETHALRLDDEREFAGVDVRRQHRHAELAGLGQVQRDLVGILRLDREQRGHEMAWIVGLEVGRLVREERVGRRVRLREAVAGEVGDVLEDLRRFLLGDAARAASLDEGGTLRLHLGGVLLPHRAAQLVGLAEREAGQLAGQTHDLFRRRRSASP